MSLNNSNYGTGIIIFNGERLLIFYDNCDIKFDDYGSNSIFKGSKSGSIYLTSHRIVFISKKSGDDLKSLSMPFVALKKIDVKQPIFGANRIEGYVEAEPNGGFNGKVQFSVTFRHGGAIEFGEALLEAGKRATKGQPAWNPPPTFFSMPTGAQYYAAPPPAYAPPYQDPYYNFVPQHQYFVQPPGNNVYMYGSAPPYPGAMPYPPQQAPQMPYQHQAPQMPYQPQAPQMPYPSQPAPQGYNAPPNNGAYGPPPPNYMSNPQPYPGNDHNKNNEGYTTKEQEAASSMQTQPPAYYSNTNPHNVYMSPAPGYSDNDTTGTNGQSFPSAPPPSYQSNSNKKND